jgi:hypothetical protein
LSETSKHVSNLQKNQAAKEADGIREKESGSAEEDAKENGFNPTCGREGCFASCKIPSSIKWDGRKMGAVLIYVDWLL